MKRVLFVCVENSCRSQMAEGFANEIGRDFFEAHSAGLQPAGAVNPRAVSAMKELSVDISSQRSKGFDDLPDYEWDAVVTIGRGDNCPSLPTRMRVDWDLPDPREKSEADFNQVRNKILVQVASLLRDLKKI